MDTPAIHIHLDVSDKSPIMEFGAFAKLHGMDYKTLVSRVDDGTFHEFKVKGGRTRYINMAQLWIDATTPMY